MKALVTWMVLGIVAAATPAMAQPTGPGVGGTWECAGQAAQRPYVCDIGEARPLSMASFSQVLREDAAIRAVVARIGVPDAVELQRVLVNDPWLGYEFRAYYREYDQMYVFGRAFILGNPEVTLLRHQGPIPESWLARRRPVQTEADAARRADEAADRAEAIADRAERLADRAESIAYAMAADFPRQLRKR